MIFPIFDCFSSRNLSVSGEAERFLDTWFMPLRREDLRHSPCGQVGENKNLCGNYTWQGKNLSCFEFMRGFPTRFPAILRVILRENLKMTMRCTRWIYLEWKINTKITRSEYSIAVWIEFKFFFFFNQSDIFVSIFSLKIKV